MHSVLLETGLAPDRLELEITEGVLIDDFSRALSILRRLKLLGVRIAMDDFGTGYSSLSNLQAFPFDKIKIDQSFVAHARTNPQSATIVRADYRPWPWPRACRSLRRASRPRSSSLPARRGLRRGARLLHRQAITHRCLFGENRTCRRGGWSRDRIDRSGRLMAAANPKPPCASGSPCLGHAAGRI